MVIYLKVRIIQSCKVSTTILFSIIILIKFMSSQLVLSNVFGYIGLVVIFIQVIFGSRHIFKYFTRDNVKMNKIHKYLGIYGTVFALAHPIEAMYSQMADWAWIYMLNFSYNRELYISLGRIALFALLFVWTTSAIVREQMKWKPWKYIHLLSYPLFVLVWIHAISIGTWANEYVLVKALLIIMMVTFVLVIVRRVLSFAGLFKLRYRIKSIENVAGETLLLTLMPSCTPNKYNESLVIPNNLKIEIGQHMYLQLDNFRSEHPFTVMEQGVNGELTFAIRNTNGFANDLLCKLTGEEIYLDGPYGVFTKEAQNADKKVIISGGVGVTPFVDLVKSYGGENTLYINCNRSEESAIRRDFIKSHVGKYADIYNNLDATQIQNIVPNLFDYKYFICGSPKMVSSIKSMLLNLNIKKESIYYEELGF